MLRKGYVQVYTGNGKGKTTAAIGLAIRALGAGLRVLILQFMKSKVYSEHDILPGISPNLTLATMGKPYFVIEEGSVPDEELAKWKDEVVIFPPGKPPADYVEIVRKGLARASEAVSSGAYDLVILDEIVVALHFGLVTWEELREVITCKLDSVELVLTGRGATPELLEAADLVTDMMDTKHYYDIGVEARKGIEC